jgi:hypothetical protein
MAGTGVPQRRQGKVRGTRARVSTMAPRADQIRWAAPRRQDHGTAGGPDPVGGTTPCPSRMGWVEGKTPCLPALIGWVAPFSAGWHRSRLGGTVLGWVAPFSAGWHRARLGGTVLGWVAPCSGGWHRARVGGTVLRAPTSTRQLSFACGCDFFCAKTQTTIATLAITKGVAPSINANIIPSASRLASTSRCFSNSEKARIIPNTGKATVATNARVAIHPLAVRTRRHVNSSLEALFGCASLFMWNHYSI